MSCTKEVKDVKVARFHVNYRSEQLEIVLNNGDTFTISKPELIEFLSLQSSDLYLTNAYLADKLLKLRMSDGHEFSVDLATLIPHLEGYNDSAIKSELATLRQNVNLLQGSQSTLQNKYTSDIQQLNTRISQLSTTIDSNNAITSGSTRKEVDAGFTELPGGLILQWGLTTFDAVYNRPDQLFNVSFGKAFPNKCLNAVTTVKMSSHGPGGDVTAQIVDFNNDTIFVSVQNMGNAATNTVVGFYWQALGY